MVWSPVQARVVVTRDPAAAAAASSSSSGSGGDDAAAMDDDDHYHYPQEEDNSVPSPSSATVPVTAKTVKNTPQRGGTTIKAYTGYGSASSSSTTTTNAGNEVEGVLELTSLNMDQHFSDGSLWLIEFYAPWCHHCNAFAPTYAQVAFELHSHNNNNYYDNDNTLKQQQEQQQQRKIRVAKVNGEQERAARSRFNIQGYPVFFLIDGWSVYKYDGARTQQNLVQFAQGGYKSKNSLPIWSSPMGPMGQVQAFMFYVGGLFVSSYTHLTVEWGLSPPVAASVFALGSLTIALFTMITVAILLSAKVKED